MKKMIQCLKFFISCTAFISCGVQKTKLSPADLKWINVYNAGDTLIFRSVNGDQDTTHIINKSVYYPQYIPGEVHGKYLPQHGILEYKNKGLEYHEKGNDLVFIIKQDPGETRLFIDYLYATVIITDLGPATLEKYRKGNLFEFDTYHPKAAPGQPKKIFWDEDRGIIRYITHADVVWERVR
jgi:hypothetical protein